MDVLILLIFVSLVLVSGAVGLFATQKAAANASVFLYKHGHTSLRTSQVYLHLKERPYTPVPFKKVGLYGFVRHPIMLGFIIAFWAAPTMTVGHLVFAVATTAYIFIGILLEERDLVKYLGDDYVGYRQKVSMIVPMPPKK